VTEKLKIASVPFFQIAYGAPHHGQAAKQSLRVALGSHLVAGQYSLTHLLGTPSKGVRDSENKPEVALTRGRKMRAHEIEVSTR
jgi:hypothetical protein